MAQAAAAAGVEAGPLRRAYRLADGRRVGELPGAGSGGPVPGVLGQLQRASLRGRPRSRANSRPGGGRRSPLGIRADRIATPFVLAGWTDAQAGIAPVLCWMLGTEGLAMSSTRSGQAACEGVSGLRRSALARCTFDTAFAGCRLTTSVLAQRTLVAAAPARHRSGGTDGHRVPTPL